MVLEEKFINYSAGYPAKIWSDIRPIQYLGQPYLEYEGRERKASESVKQLVLSYKLKKNVFSGGGVGLDEFHNFG